jgi:hypothetical protein
MTRAEAAALGRKTKAEKIGPWPLRFWEKVDIRSDDECWPWMAAERKKGMGYGAFYLGGRHQPAQRVAVIATGGIIPKGFVVCHRCDNPPCCNPSHLWVGTPAQNDADKVAKGRQCRGSKQKYAVATEEQVIRLRELNKQVGLREAARIMGINYFTAWNMCHRSWRHICR